MGKNIPTCGCLLRVLVAAGACIAARTGVAAAAGPDIIVGEVAGFNDIIYWGSSGVIKAYSFRTEACNIGTTPANWISTTNQHPVIAQNMFRLMDGRFEQIGQAWVKHGFNTENEDLCGVCQPTAGQSLGVGCSDTYQASLNGAQALLGPKSEVNASTGQFPYPFSGPPPVATIGRRLQVDGDDLDASSNPGALFFLEGHYVAADDAVFGNAANNASWRRVNYNSATSTMTPVGSTFQQQPAILAWQANDPSVRLSQVVVQNDGATGINGWFWVGSKATYLGDCQWHYEYAVQNLNSHQSCNLFAVVIPDGVTVTNRGFRSVPYHSGEPYLPFNWASSLTATEVKWSTGSFAQSPNANALRWGTLFNFRFDADAPPTCDGSVSLGLYRSPERPRLVVTALAPRLGSACSRSGDLDFDCDVDGEDFGRFLASFGRCNGEPNYDAEADMDLDLCVQLVDYQLWLARYREYVGDPAAAAPTPIFPLILGDVNCDGSITPADADVLVQVLLGQDTDVHHAEAADVDASGGANAADIGPFIDKLFNPN